MSNIIETKNLTKRFGNLTAVDDLTISLEPGKIYGFLGPNGAGKTTTMAMIMDLIMPTSGEIFIDGHKSEQKKQKSGYSPEFPSFYTILTV